MPTLFANLSKDERKHLYMTRCIPIRIILYIMIFIIVLKYPRYMFPLLKIVLVLAILIMIYQSVNSPAWWPRWPHILTCILLLAIPFNMPHLIGYVFIYDIIVSFILFSLFFN
jgi:hypothetical protein